MFVPFNQNKSIRKGENEQMRKEGNQGTDVQTMKTCPKLLELTAEAQYPSSSHLHVCRK